MAGLLICTCYRTYGATVHPATPVRRTNKCLLMISALTLLLVYQLVGEVIVRLLQLPVPGPVLGMVLLFLTLVLRGEVSPTLRDAANGLLQHLSLLFVPAGVGVMVHARLIAAEWVPILVALVGGTAIALVVTALVLRAMVGRRRAGTEGN